MKREIRKFVRKSKRLFKKIAIKSKPKLSRLDRKISNSIYREWNKSPDAFVSKLEKVQSDVVEVTSKAKISTPDNFDKFVEFKDNAKLISSNANMARDIFKWLCMLTVSLVIVVLGILCTTIAVVPAVGIIMTGIAYWNYSKFRVSIDNKDRRIGFIKLYKTSKMRKAFVISFVKQSEELIQNVVMSTVKDVTKKAKNQKVSIDSNASSNGDGILSIEYAKEIASKLDDKWKKEEQELREKRKTMNTGKSDFIGERHIEE